MPPPDGLSAKIDTEANDSEEEADPHDHAEAVREFTITQLSTTARVRLLLLEHAVVAVVAGEGGKGIALTVAPPCACIRDAKSLCQITPQLTLLHLAPRGVPVAHRVVFLRLETREGERAAQRCVGVRVLRGGLARGSFVVLGRGRLSLAAPSSARRWSMVAIRDGLLGSTQSEGRPSHRPRPPSTF